MQRVALAKRCFAEPGSYQTPAPCTFPGSAVHRSARATRCAASGERSNIFCAICRSGRPWRGIFRHRENDHGLRQGSW